MIKGKYVLVGKKKFEYYKGLLVRADTGLHDQIAAIVKKKLPNGGRIIDFGCGQGALSLRLHDMGYEMLAVDIDPEDFKCKEVPFEQLNFNNKSEIEGFLEKYENNFDLVLGVEVIEHVENPWEYVRTLKTLAKKGGYILVSTPNTTSWLSRLLFLFTGKFHRFIEDSLSYGHISPITSYHLGVILRYEHFDDVTIQPGGLLPPFWLIADKKIMFFNLLNLFFYPFMRSIKKGWCIIATGRKS
jgi:cyclopropane fatty-acyl-phospholipid synthase-like methyltransferase